MDWLIQTWSFLQPTLRFTLREERIIIMEEIVVRAKARIVWNHMKKSPTSFSSHLPSATSSPQLKLDHCPTGSGLPVLKLKTNVLSSSRPLCISTCLQCNQTSSYTASTPIPLIPIKPQMFLGMSWNSTTPSPGWHVTQQHRTDDHVYPFTLWCSTRCTTSSWTCYNREPVTVKRKKAIF